MGHRIGTSHEGLGHDSALDPRRHRSLALGRRTLLSGLGLGVTAGVVGLTAPAASGASRPRVPTGFAVGSRVPQMQGLDQFGAATKLVDGSSWTMIDACAWWCDPCRRSATLHHAFSDYLHSQGVAFRLVSVIEQDFDGAVANGSDAESWAWHYDLERDRVMHPGGDAASPLAQVSSRFADAAGVANAIPCYVLLDPAGVVRVYERGYVTERQGQWIATMNAMQSVIGAATGKSLDRVWDVDSLSAASPRQTGLVSYARAHAVGATVLHGAFDVTLDGGQDHETAGVGLAEGSLHTVGDPGLPGSTWTPRCAWTSRARRSLLVSPWSWCWLLSSSASTWSGASGSTRRWTSPPRSSKSPTPRRRSACPIRVVWSPTSPTTGSGTSGF